MNRRTARVATPIDAIVHAVVTLRPEDGATRAAILSCLGHHPAASERSEQAVSTTMTGDRAKRRDKRPAPERAHRSRKRQEDADGGPVVPSVLERSGDEDGEPPPWFADTPALPDASKTRWRAPKPEPLLTPRLARTILASAAAVQSAAGEFDVEAALDRIVRFLPLVDVPRRAVPSLARGAMVLVDGSDGMEPFRDDVRNLVRSLVATIGRDRVAIWHFLDSPGDGVRQSPIDELREFVPPRDGKPVLVVSHLGLAGEDDAGIHADEWRKLALAVRRAGSVAVFVAPFQRSRWPIDSTAVRELVWDRRLSSATPRIRAVAPLDGNTTQLAVLASLATRIEPALLRSLRLHAAPWLGAGTEADLWFSSAVERRASTGIVLRRDVVRLLREQLAANPDMLDTAWQITRRVHASAPLLLRQEEELNYRATLGDEVGIRDVLRQLVKTLATPGRDSVASWASAAFARFPDAVREHREVTMLAAGAAMRVGATFEDLPLGDSDRRGGWRWLRPETETRLLGVTLRTRAIEFSPDSSDGTHTLEVPDTKPIVVELAWREDDRTEVRQERVDSSVRRVVPVDTDEVEIRVIGGDRFTLRRQRPEDAAPNVTASSQQKIERVRLPRVVIEYEVEAGGAMRMVELPFVVGVIADLAGNAHAEFPPLHDRKFIEVDRDNFDEVMEAMQPRIRLQIAQGDALVDVDLVIAEMADFRPARLCAQIPALAPLLDERRRLADESARKDSPDLHADEIARIDSELSHGVSQVLDHEEFRRLEGAWRGLHLLVFETETGPSLRIKVLHATKPELGKDASAGESGFDALFRQVVWNEYGVMGGHPFGCLIVDHEFDHDAEDIHLLRAFARLGVAAHAPCIAGASPRLFGVDRWADLYAIADLGKVFDSAEYTQWRQLRSDEESRFLALTGPRVLARLAYDPESYPIDEFAFREQRDDGVSAMTWMSSVYAFATNLTRAFSLHGWLASIRGIEGGGLVPFLPVDRRSDNETLGPIEVSITEHREREMADHGVNPIVAQPDTNNAVFFSVRSVHEPEYGDAEVDDIAILASSLDNLFAATRFAQYVRCMLRDKIGSFLSLQDMESFVNRWLLNYVLADPSSATREMMAKHPLSEARAEAMETPQHEGKAALRLYVRPSMATDSNVTLRVDIPVPNE